LQVRSPQYIRRRPVRSPPMPTHRCFLRCPIPITNGLSRLTNLPQLAELNLHYCLGNYINTQLLLDFTRSCPRLDTIAVADYNSSTSSSNNPDPGQFETKAISELFAAGAELCTYFEPHYSPPSLNMHGEGKCWISTLSVSTTYGGINHHRNDGEGGYVSIFPTCIG
jgi:hypothetical protein